MKSQIYRIFFSGVLFLILIPVLFAFSADQDNLTTPRKIKSLTPIWTGESDAAGAKYGVSVATAGDVNGDGYADIVVGAYEYVNGLDTVGKVYVYYGSATGPGTSPDWWATGGQVDSMTGLAVATAGDVNGDGYSDIIVGAPGFDNPQVDEGIAVAYYGSASGMGAVDRDPDWFVQGNQDSGFFGASVSTAGDVNGDGYSDVIVGAYLFDNGETDEGAVFIYQGSATGLSTTPARFLQSDHAGEEFGFSVNTAGDVNRDGYSDIVIGAPEFDVDVSDTNEGKAYVFKGSATGVEATPVWSYVGENAGDKFGFAVSSAGSIRGNGICDIVVGAPGHTNSTPNDGAIYIFHGHLSQGVESTYSDFKTAGNSGEFGRSIGCAGDVNGDGFSDIIIGQPFSSDQSGEFIVFLGTTNGNFKVTDIPVTGDQDDANLGISVGTAGDVNGDGYSDIIAGAWLYDHPEIDEGRVYVFAGGPDEISSTASWSDEIDQESANFGCSVASAGDVNGDGYSDVIVGATGFRPYPYATTGAIYVYLGSHLGLSTNCQRIDGNYDGMKMGFCVASAGDVNGDGFDDVIFSAPSKDPGGEVYLHNGTSSGIQTSPSLIIDTEEYGAKLGKSIASAGDINGDGYSDIIVGAYMWDSGRGVVTVYFGSPSGLNPVAGWAQTGSYYHDYYGYSVAGAGDVNGDGYSDIIIGAYGASYSPDTDGAVYVYHGSPSGLTDTPQWVKFDPNTNVSAQFGYCVASAGDVNGDGYSDVIIGEPSYGGSGTSQPAGAGRALVYLGSSSGLEATAAWTYSSGVFERYIARTVACAGDVNGDGYSDIMVGDTKYSNGQTSEGRVMLFYGSSNGPSTTIDTWRESNYAESLFGCSFASAGDVDGDSFSDIIIGARELSNGEYKEGEAFLYCGNDGYGRGMRAHQTRINGTTRVGHLGTSHSLSQIGINLLGRFPGGLTNVKLQWELRCYGDPLDGLGIHDGAAWHEILSDAIPLSAIHGDLNEDTLYHWRARVLYEPGNFLGLHHSRWFYPWYNGNTEADFRTGNAYTATPSPLPTSAPTMTATRTHTPIPNTPTPTPSFTVTMTSTPALTITPTPTRTPTVTSQPTDTPLANDSVQMGDFCVTEWDATAFNNSRKIVRDYNGYYHAVFHSQKIDHCDAEIPGNPPAGGRPCAIYYTRSATPADAGNPGPPPWSSIYWDTPVVVANTDDTVDDRYPAIAIEYGPMGAPSSNDRIHIVWQRERAPGDVYDIYYSTCEITSEPCHWEDGMGHDGMRVFYQSADTDGNLVSRNSLVPSIDINHDNYIHVAWQEENFKNTEPFTSEFSEILYKGSAWIEWSNPIKYTKNISASPSANSQMPSLACCQDTDSSSTDPYEYRFASVHIVWNEDVTPSSPHIMYCSSSSNGDPSTWSTVSDWSLAAGSNGSDGYPSLVVNATNTLYCVWMHPVTPDDPDGTTNGGRGDYGPGVDPSDAGGSQESFPGPEVGMYGASNQQIWFYSFESGGMVVNDTTERPSDSEFPTIICNKWGLNSVLVYWQGEMEGDYDIWHASYSGNFDDDSNPFSDPLHDEFFPSSANKKQGTHVNYSQAGQPFHDLLWTKIDMDASATGHGATGAVSPTHELWFHGNTKWLVPSPIFTPTPIPPTPTPAPPSPSPTPECIHDGDVNADGAVSSGDAQLAFQITLGIITPTQDQSCAADCNADNNVSSGDAQLIFQTALGIGNCMDPISL